MKQKNILKVILAAIAIIGAGTIFFYSVSETTLASNDGKVEKVPTTYQVADSTDSALPKTAEGGEEKETAKEKVNYTLCLDDLNVEMPTDTDLTMEEAAETGAQYLKDIFGLDLDGAYVYMSYCSGTETFPRAFWSGDVLFEKEQTPESTRWYYLMDAVTGELFTISYSRQLDVNVSLAYDAALEKDYSVYAELAKKKAEECNLLDCPIDRVEYNCQGYGGNDPTIAMDVIGENGKIFNLDFSRYDQTFLGFISDTSRKITESAFESAVGEVESVEAQYIESNTVTWTTSMIK
ncbi:MAG: hypothetical protein OSJ72_19090 [Lachnospiraceae bacterium]|nr:hypothetical protein [Lachnospiraceae bacterium]